MSIPIDPAPIPSVAELISNMTLMDDFIHRLADAKLCNVSGSAHRQVRLARTEYGVVLVSDHHTSLTCWIAIAERPNIVIRKGYDDSCGNGDPNPVPAEGKLVVVWSNGKWARRGPWEAPVTAMIGRARRALQERIDAAVAAERAKLEAAERAREEAERALVEAWS